MSKTLSMSPAFEDRELSTYRMLAKVTLDGSSSTIDVNGLTVAGTATGFTISGFEAAADIALDSGRDAAVQFYCLGTVATAEEGAIWIKDATISGTAGSRVITVDVNVAAAAALDLTSDSITDAQLDICFPTKQKDF